MITAIPMKQDRVASHFTKADSFIFLDENGDVKARKENPALNANCSGKADLLTMLQEENVQRVIVRNIGERILGKLIDSKFSVYQTNCGRQDAKELVSEQANMLTQLTSASQGRQSLNYEAKQAKGGCGCNHGDHDHHGKCCDESNPSGQEHHHGSGRCCQRQNDSQKTNHGHGNGRCCH
jgi:predicted Fe-Mo cluster-binding NifX family protein|nr:NifB/NifX family molybdenum-iron cluster-binding protein [uncultured Tolumonas sp.]